MVAAEHMVMIRSLRENAGPLVVDWDACVVGKIEVVTATTSGDVVVSGRLLESGRFSGTSGIVDDDEEELVVDDDEGKLIVVRGGWMLSSDELMRLGESLELGTVATGTLANERLVVDVVPIGHTVVVTVGKKTGATPTSAEATDSLGASLTGRLHLL